MTRAALLKIIAHYLANEDELPYIAGQVDEYAQQAREQGFRRGFNTASQEALQSMEPLRKHEGELTEVLKSLDLRIERLEADK